MTQTTLTADPTTSTDVDAIRIRGARVHNLKDVDLDIPRDRLIVITGPSGSGKSSLAIDTLCAEGQRQYVESLSTSARQFLTQMERPDVDLIEGLPPTIAIDQRAGNPNPRSTVATVTEIYDHLRLLFARLGDASCYQCGQPIRQQTPEQIVESLYELPEGTKAMILAPMIRGRRGAHDEVFTAIYKAGFVRVRVDGEIYDIEDVPELSSRKNHDIEAVIDRVVVRRGVEARISESIDLAVHYGEETVIVCYHNGDKSAAKTNGNDRKQVDSANGAWTDILFSTRYACPSCGISYEELEPRTFSFNSPYGACPTCDGLGYRVEFDPELVVPDPQLSLHEDAVAAWRGMGAKAWARHAAVLKKFLAARRANLDTPLSKLTDKTYEQLIRGTTAARGGMDFVGILNMLEKEFATTTSESRQAKLAAYRGEVVCADCGGARLRAEARHVRFAGMAISEVTALPVSRAIEFFASASVDDRDEPIYDPIAVEIKKRLRFLGKVGLGYLSLDRSSDSLSGGELQRVRLATGIGSGLVGVCYVLDEPSIGLHPRDNNRLIAALRDLVDLGNTVLVVEHDEAMMRASDQLIDMGPGAGEQGGEIVAAGPPEEVCRAPQSITARYLAGEQEIPVPPKRRRLAKTRALDLLGVRTNNLKNVDVRIPLGGFVCVSGVSGSGKSSLVNETLGRALSRRLQGTGPKPGPHKGLRGVAKIDRVIQIDQSPLGRTPRSNAATYTGLFDEVRKVFAGTRGSKQRGFAANRFSFNVKGGRCEVCQGQGQQKLDMNFLPDLYVTCNECGGARFNPQTLAVKYRDRSIADILDMQIADAHGFFENFASIDGLLGCLEDVGLGYLPLGQPSTTLSGGEAQRIKLATELARGGSDNTLYILDEPTTGLHFDDIRKLLGILSRLVDQGNTVLVIEHNLDVIKTADWIIDLGPEGGEEGGRVVATGTPEQVADVDGNHTGRFLKKLLRRRN